MSEIVKRALRENDVRLRTIRVALIGNFGLGVAGSRVRLSDDNFSELLRNAGREIKIDIGPSLGSRQECVVDLSFARLSEFSRDSIIARVPLLSQLAALAAGLSRGSLGREESINRLTALVGEGPLVERARSRVSDGLTRERPLDRGSEPPAEAGGQPNLVEELLSRGRSRGRSALDSFVRASTSPKRESKRMGAVPEQGEPLHQAVLGVIEKAVLAIRGAPRVAAVETAFRSLKLFLREIPRDRSLVLVLVERGGEPAARVADKFLESEPEDTPDLVVVMEESGGEDALGDVERLARIAAELYSPIVVGASPSLWGARDLSELLAWARDSHPLEGWSTLRSSDASKWLTVVVNSVALFRRGGNGELGFMSPAAAVGLALIASYRRTGAFADTVGRQGSIRAPLVHRLNHLGRDIGIPTAAFVPQRDQASLLRWGILGLGSARDSDLAVVPYPKAVSSEDGAALLPSQIIVGRLVKLGKVFRDRVATIAGESIFEEIERVALSLLLPDVPREGARFSMARSRAEESIILSLSVAPRFAGGPFEVSIALPLA